MRKHVFTILTLLFVALVSKAQINNLHCLEVNSDEVTLRWGLVGDEADFLAYYIYTGTQVSSFVLVDSVLDYNQVSMVHNNPLSVSQKVGYYVVTKMINDVYNTSNTLYTMYLEVTPDILDPFKVNLEWNKMQNPILAGFGDTYVISASGNTSGFYYQATTQDTTHEIEVHVCNDNISFQISLDHSLGCTSFSNISEELITDNDPPPIPTLDSVSIDPFTGEAMLGWTQSSAPDAGGYQIYVINVINDTLEPVYGVGNTFFIDDSFDPCSENRTYAIAAFDTCGNISPGTYFIPQRTIYLEDIVFDPCALSNTISWTAYINMEPALAGYHVYLSEDGSAYSLLSTVGAGNTSYMHAGLEPGHTYSYFIRAFSAGEEVTSTSCIKSYTSWQYLQPIDNQMGNASVESSEYVDLILQPDTLAYVPYVQLYRSDDGSQPWELLDELEALGQSELFYEDVTADVNSQSYYYRTSLIDSCGNEVLTSDAMRTVFLQGVSEGQLNTLEWNAFEGWPQSVVAYEIYRAVNEDGSFEKAGETDGNTLIFSDDITSVPGEYTMLRYLVRALQDANANRYSWSNEIFFEYTPTLFLPNAFKPGGQNPVYKPVAANADFSEYLMEVYNRWGELIFSSQDFGLGWDGTVKGSDAPSGVYVCILNYRSASTENTTMKTTFVLIR